MHVHYGACVRVEYCLSPPPVLVSNITITAWLFKVLVIIIMTSKLHVGSVIGVFIRIYHTDTMTFLPYVPN